MKSVRIIHSFFIKKILTMGKIGKLTNRIYSIFINKLLNYKNINTNHSKVVSYRVDLSGVIEIYPIDKLNIYDYLPKKLIINSGMYTFKKELYELMIPGLYRFSKPEVENAQRIVLDKNNPLNSSLYLSLCSCRGNSDNRIPFNQLEKISQNRFLVLTCGRLVNFAVNQLNKNNIHCRNVNTHTLSILNSYNNGHSILEVWYPKYNKYVAVDLDKKCYFIKDGILLNVYELTREIYYKQPFKIIFASDIPLIDYSGFTNNYSNFNYQFIEYAIYSSTNGIENYLRRICQVPIINFMEEKYVCTWDNETKNRLKSINHNWILLSEKEFYSKFYLGRL